MDAPLHYYGSFWRCRRLLILWVYRQIESYTYTNGGVVRGVTKLLEGQCRHRRLCVGTNLFGYRVYT